MNVKAIKQVMLTITVILTVPVSLANFNPVLAEESLPPAVEPAATEETEAGESTDKISMDPVTKASSDESIPTEEVPTCDSDGETTDSNPTGDASVGEEQPLIEVVEALDENGIVLVDSQGEAIPLASEDTAEILGSARDPWFVDSDGSVIGYTTLSGTCAAVVTTCNQVSTPLQAAITAAPVEAVITIDGTCSKQVIIDKDLTR